MTKPVNMIVVDADGEIITAANGKISSDNPELVKRVKDSVKIPWPVQLVAPQGRRVQPSLDPSNLLGITAALYSVKPGRTRLLEAPDEVLEWFREERLSRGGCIHHTANATSDFEFRNMDELAGELVEYLNKNKRGTI